MDYLHLNRLLKMDIPQQGLTFVSGLKGNILQNTLLQTRQTFFIKKKTWENYEVYGQMKNSTNPGL